MAKIPIPNVDHFHPEVYYCRRSHLPASIDGDIEKAFWQEAPWTHDFVDIEGDRKAKPAFRTRAKMLWDDHYLYIGAQLFGNEIWATIREHDEVIFKDNDFEVFLDPLSQTHPYYELEINAWNTTWDLMLPKPYRDGGDAIHGFEIHGLQSAVKIDGEINNPDALNRMWSVEIALPFKAFADYHRGKSLTPKVGSYWRMNFSRVHWHVDVVDGQYVKKNLPEENWVWSPMGVINMHYPELWPFLFFCDDQYDYSIPEDEQRKWQLRQIYYLEHDVWEKTHAFSSDITIADPPEDLRIQVTDTWFELSCLASDPRYRIYMYADGRTHIA